MQPFRVHILGCGSALPTLKHFATCQVVEIRNKCFMIDCGEGAQIQLRRTHIHFTAIQSIFISHLHGDHCFGLMGMICSFGMLGREAPLHIYAPEGLEGLLKEQMEMFCPGLQYEVVVHTVNTQENKVVYEDRSLTIETIPLNHRISCCGYLFREKPLLPHIRRDMIDYLNIPLSQINNIKMGGGWTTEEGIFYEHERLVTPADKPRAYAYCSDTAYMPGLHELVKGVDLLYHESTYCDDKLDNALKYYHSTARQAAQVAKDAGVKKLLLGHYSARYNDESKLEEEAREVFKQSFLTQENMIVDV